MEEKLKSDKVRDPSEIKKMHETLLKHHKKEDSDNEEVD